jgi:hypothetical protein
MNQSNEKDLLGVGAQFDINEHRAAMNMNMRNHQVGYVRCRTPASADDRNADLRIGDSATDAATLFRTVTTTLPSGTHSSAAAYSLNPVRPTDAVEQQDSSRSPQNGIGYNAMKRWYQEQASEQPWNCFNSQEKTEKK